eukprot:364349-Chlamydomonas_euryale.AAC.15
MAGDPMRMALSVKCGVTPRHVATKLRSMLQAPEPHFHGSTPPHVQASIHAVPSSSAAHAVPQTGLPHLHTSTPPPRNGMRRKGAVSIARASGNLYMFQSCSIIFLLACGATTHASSRFLPSRIN